MKNVLLAFLFLFSIPAVSQIIILRRPPAIVTQPPVTQTICNGSTATIGLTASGIPGPTYQWYSNTRSGCEFCDVMLVNGAQFSGVTTATLSINTTGDFGAGTYYYCIATNEWGTANSNDASITIAGVPVAVSSVTGAVSCTPAALTLTATGANRIEHYNWYDNTGAQIAGATTSTYTTPPLTASAPYYVALATATCVGPQTEVDAIIDVLAAPPISTTSSCGPGAITLSDYGSKHSFHWYNSDGTLIAGYRTNTYITPVLTSTTTYYASIFDANCESPKTTVTATITPIPAAPTAVGRPGCGPSQVLLTASGGSEGQYRWYPAVGVGAIAGATSSTYTTPMISASTTYYVSINTGICEGPLTPVAATINSIPALPSVANGAACGPAADTLNASGASAGQYRWHSAAGVAITGATNARYITPVLSATTNYLVSINNGNCESAKVAISGIINSLPTPPTATAAATPICASGATTLTAIGGSAGQYRWYTAAGVLIARQTNSTYTTPTLTSTTSYLVSINNGTCESTKTSVIATVNSLPIIPGTSGNAACGSSAIVVNATGATNGQYRWYTAAGVAISGATNSSYTTPVLSATTNYLVSINNGTCEGAKASVTAVINTPPASPGTSGNSICGPGAVTINGSGGAAGQYRWYTSAGVSIGGQTNNSYTTPVLTTTTSYLVSINNGTCESSKTSVTATINGIPSTPTTSGNAACGASSLTLNASGGSPGQYRWYSGGVPISGQTNNSYITPVISATTTYSVSINNGTCESGQALVTATINGLPAAPTVNGGAACGSSTVTLSASGGSTGQYRWYAGGVQISGQVNSTYTTPVISSTTSYAVSLNNGTCEGPQATVMATINSIPTSPTTTGASSCSSAALTLTASGGTNGQYRWYNSSGSLINGEVNSTYTTPVITAPTQYFVSVYNGICESSKISVVAQINSANNSPLSAGSFSCGPGPVTITAMGASDGQFRWYTDASGGTPISGAVNGSYVTPSISTSDTYYVSIYNGTCESGRSAVVAEIRAIPASPVVTGANTCSGKAVQLLATGASDGQYRWYTAPTGGSPIDGVVNGAYTIAVLTKNTTYYVSINDGSCESARVAVTATINPCNNEPPIIATQKSTTTPGGEVTIDLHALISDPNNNVDYSTLKIVPPGPTSGATASINANGILILEYAGLAFTGVDTVKITVCDVDNACTVQTFIVDVEGNIVVYNGISPNNDSFNQTWIIENIADLPSTKSNHVSLYDRWGDLVFEIDDYNNNDHIFKGIGKSGNDVPSGIYFYKIEYKLGRKADTGYLALKR